ncbi:hypothetical protein EYF80_055391 [Liparis tanakae]|uniref:Uncharacterized protein n=1 Tax=Liparis tanakae TaxID=230148 RepID=A0A4Z2F1B3_9TELE|nr:hypothetical protein EYF80_055391 [Liparis tanakae]
MPTMRFLTFFFPVQLPIHSQFLPIYTSLSFPSDTAVDPIIDPPTETSRKATLGVLLLPSPLPSLFLQKKAFHVTEAGCSLRAQGCGFWASRHRTPRFAL